jgi:sulfopropanediol 3-dehydrogenase
MAIQYLKKSSTNFSDFATASSETESIVSGMLQAMSAKDGAQKALDYAAKLDGWSGDPLVTQEQIDKASASISDQAKEDIHFAYTNVSRFAQAQKDSLTECEVELTPGVFAGHVLRPIESVGCYVPGGRYAHICSAIMTITTAKIAGVKEIIACSPPRGEEGIDPHILYTMHYCGADKILSMGGVQGVAAMTNGFFGITPVNMLVGPGNRFVAEAKRQLFGGVGIDQIAGPTEIAIIADKTADAEIVAVDLVGQAEHGLDSPAWLITDDKALAEKVIQRVPELIDELPEDASKAAAASWADFGEVVLCDTREEMVKVSDEYAAEHLEVHTEDLNWWLSTLNNYGSLFLGEETTVAYGDKCSGTNHVLPTRGVAKYTGGLSVQKFIKVLSYQRLSKEATEFVGKATARLSRLEGMEAHARTADVRVNKYL